MKLIDITNKKFGRLLVLYAAEHNPKRKKKEKYWTCLCDCGTIKDINGYSLRVGDTKSCGCYVKERIKNQNLSHGMVNSKEYKSWLHMKYRCLNKNSKKYKIYGGRGIKVCDKWINSFEEFLKDVGFAPSSIHTLDRIDVNGNYEPSNCRWATPLEQSANKRNTIYIEYENELVPMCTLARILGINYKYFWKLYTKDNLSVEDIIIKNTNKNKK